MIFTLFLSLTAAFWIDPETDRCYLRPPNPICPGSLVNGPGRVLRYPENDRMTSWEYARQLCNKFVAQIDGQLDTVATCDWSTGDRWFDNKYEFTVTVENGTEPDLVCPFEVEVIRRRCNRRLTLNAALEIEEPDRCPEPTKREDHIMRLVAEAEERADALRAEAEAKRLHAEAVLMGKRAAAENRAKAAARAVLEDEMLAQAGPYPEFGSYNDKAAWMQKRQAILPCRERYNYYSCRPSSNTDCVTGVGPCECRWDAEVFFLGSDICPGANEDEPKGPECSEAEVQPGQDPFCMDLPCNERMSIFQCRQYECENSPEGCECQWDADYEFLGVQQCPGVNEWDLDRCYYQVADHPPFCGPEPTATTAPTAAPTAFPTPQPTSSPTPLPTAAPTAATASPTKQPTSSPTPQPTGNPTVQPTSNPTDQPTSSPTPQPTDSPTHQPTLNPTAQPTDSPTNQPTSNPTPQPTDSPTLQPTANPTAQPTDSPTPQPTANPTAQPTDSPTNQPTTSPTPQPTSNPTRQPTASPSQIPTASPTPQPTAEPTGNPTPQPTDSPTVQPTANPTAQPTDSPTPQPTANPTVEPTASPTVQPTANPTAQPTDSPTNQPTSSPTDQPTSSPTTQPTAQPTAQPTTANPTANPTPNPTASPTTQPTAQPTLATKSPTPNPTLPTVAPPIYDGPTIDDVAEVIVRTLRYASYEQRLLCPVSYIRIKGDCSPEIEDVSEVCPLLAASFYEQGLNVLQCRCKIRGASRWFKWARGKIDCVVATEYIEADQAAALRAPNVNIDSAEIVGEDEALSFFGLSNNDSSDNQIVAIVIAVVALLALCACCAAAVLFGTARRRSTGKGVSAAPMSVMHTPRESMKSSFATEAVDLEYDGTRSRKSPRRSTLALSQRAASPGAESPRRSSRRQHSRRVSREQRGNNAFSTVHDLRSFSGGDAAAADAHPMGPRSMSETHFSPDDIARARAAHAGESPF